MNCNIYFRFGLRVAVLVFLLGCAVAVEGRLKPPGGAVNRSEELASPTDGCRLNEKPDALFVVLVFIKLKPLFDAWDALLVVLVFIKLKPPFDAWA